MRGWLASFRDEDVVAGRRRLRHQGYFTRASTELNHLFTFHSILEPLSSSTSKESKKGKQGPLVVRKIYEKMKGVVDGIRF